MSTISAKIDDMRSVSWPLAIVISVAIVVIGIVAIVKGSEAVTTVGAVLLLVFGALGLGKLDEIRTNTNGTNNRLLEENAAARRQLADLMSRALVSPPILPPDEKQP